MNGSAVVDASLAVKWLIEEEHSDKATALVRRLDSEGTRLAAPYLMPTEVANVLHQRVLRGHLSVGMATRLLQDLMAVGVELHEFPELHARALTLASVLQQGAVYDAHYLALSETLDCELWTADKKFLRAAETIGGNVRWIGEFDEGASARPGP